MSLTRRTITAMTRPTPSTKMLCRSAIVAAVAALHAPAHAQEAPPPNVLFIMADDLGYGEVGFNGQERIATPHIDRLAAEGLVLDAHYSGSTVCAPSRASLMSGLHGGHAPVRGNAGNVLPDTTVTLAEVLGGAGYRTAMFGKWGLGDLSSAGEPNRQGFGHYLGYLGQVHAHNHFPSWLVRDGARVELDNEVVEAEVPYAPFIGTASTNKSTYTQDLFTAGAAEFIREAAAAGEPFFVYLPLIIPHVNNESHLIGAHGMEVPDLGRYATEDWPEVERAKAAMITYMDEDVGELVALVDSLSLGANTLVVFTSDNGPTAEQVDPAFFEAAGPYRGHKRDLYEGGIRVPTVVRWPGTAPAGERDDTPSAFWDWRATLADLAGADALGGDGVSLLPLLRGGEAPAVAERPYLYWEFTRPAQGGRPAGALQAVRAGRWKWIRDYAAATEELYDLEADPGETTDVSAREPAELTRLRSYAEAAHVPHPTYPLPGEG